MTPTPATRQPPPPPPIFSDRELAILRAFAADLLPGGAPPAPAAADLDLRDGCEIMFRKTDWLVTLGFRAMIWGMELAAVIVTREHSRLTRLSPRDRARYLGRWAECPWYPVRLCFLGLKALVGMAYCDHPAYGAAVGYAPECQHEGRALRPVECRP